MQQQSLKVEQQSQAKQEQGALKHQLDTASKKKVKRKCGGVKRSAALLRRQNRGGKRLIGWIFWVPTEERKKLSPF